MPKTYWRTYTGKQAGELTAALQALSDGGLLTKDEEEIARRIRTALGYAIRREGVTLLKFSADEDHLLSHVEGALWR